MFPNRNADFKRCGPQPSYSSSVNGPWPKLINLDIAWLKDNGWPNFESFMIAHNCEMGDRGQFISAITVIQHLRWSGTKLPNITQAIVNSRFGLRYDSQKCLYVPISPQIQRSRNNPRPSIEAQDRKGKPNTEIPSEYDIPELYDGSIRALSNIQHGSDDKGKYGRGTSEEDDTVEPLSNFKAWKGKSASCVSEEEDYIVSMPSTKPWKGKSVRWKSDGDEIIEPTSNTKNCKALPVEKWTRKWSNEIDELRKSCGATNSRHEENEEENPEDGGIRLGEMMRNLDLEYESNDDDDYYKHDESEDDTLTLGASLGNSSPETLPSSSSEPMTSNESLESK